MLFTVPTLSDDGEDAFVEPDVPMKDDGLEGAFAKAYIRDEIPWFDLRHEVRDLMLLAVPGLAGYEELEFADAEIPEDGMEVCWAEPAPQDAPETEAVADLVVRAIAAAVAVAMVSAPAEVPMIGMPEEAPVELPELDLSIADDTVCEEAVCDAVAEIPMVAAPAAVPMIAMPEEAPVELPELDLDLDEPVAEVECTDMAVLKVPEAIEVPAEVTVIEPTEEAASEAADEGDAVTEDSPAVRFSFGSQEVRGRGWRVCFSF